MEIQASELDIDYGTVTNNGTLQANSGNLLHLVQAALTNFSGNTLTGGTYNVYGAAGSPGTLQIDALGSSGGEIQNNAATILLSGPNSNFVDQAGLDALSQFSNNTAAGSFTIQNGRNFTSPGDFANAGTVNIGAGSTFTTGPGAADNFNQTAGMTQVGGTLATSNANISGGLFGGTGTVAGNVNMLAGTTIKAGDAPGILTINGSLSLGGTLLVDIEGTTAGAGGYSQLVVNGGKASLGGTLDVDLLNGFSPTPGEDFYLLTSTGGDSGTFSTLDVQPLPVGEAWLLNYNPASCPYGDSGCLELEVETSTSPTPPPVTVDPEPSTMVLVATGLVGFLARRRMKRRSGKPRV